MPYMLIRAKFEDYHTFRSVFDEPPMCAGRMVLWELESFEMQVTRLKWSSCWSGTIWQKLASSPNRPCYEKACNWRAG